MSRKQPPPLTPADSKYLGEDANGRHALRWRSQSRDTVTHVSEGRIGGPHTCDCEWFMVMRKQGVRSPSCKHTRGHDDAVAHHLAGGPPPDPGGSPTCPDCGRPCELLDMDDGDPDDVWRWTCDHCETAWPPTELPIPPEDPGGAAGEPPEPAGPTEREDAARDARTVAPIRPLDRLLAERHGAWLVTRSELRVTLTCASCAGTYRFNGEDQARRFVELALPCDQCGATAGPTPPAPGAARKPLDDCLQDLYGG